MKIEENKKIKTMKSRKRKYAEDDDRQTILIRYRIPKHTYERIKATCKQNLIKPNEFINDLLEDYHTDIIEIWSSEDLIKSLDELSGDFKTYFNEKCQTFIDNGITSIEEFQMELSKSVQYVHSGEEFIDGNLRVREIIYKTIKEYSAIFNRSINAELLIRIDRKLNSQTFNIESEKKIMKLIIFKAIADGFIQDIKGKI
ncbi:hypothetical protein [Rosenbergiella collisarenosi]|uniref:hypothetical protein n=1 Tax=Rosenbergiella collisarenosi TaxID=1544695 RepID=UPI001F4E9AE3|nr:hypothetical protein [Rosenbergiella collisarenosi]